jgi:hypothetical protein
VFGTRRPHLEEVLGGLVEHFVEKTLAGSLPSARSVRVRVPESKCMGAAGWKRWSRAPCSRGHAGAGRERRQDRRRTNEPV